MDEMLFRVFAENAGRYLDAVDKLADRFTTTPASRQAGAVLSDELRRLVAAWRALLDLHRPEGPRARCAGCTARLSALRRRPAMCSVWKVANAYFVRAPGE